MSKLLPTGADLWREYVDAGHRELVLHGMREQHDKARYFFYSDQAWKLAMRVLREAARKPKKPRRVEGKR